MPIHIKGQTYYRTAEVCNEIGISRATLYRWLKAGLLDKSHKDRRGWRLFTEADLSKFYVKAIDIQIEHVSIQKSEKSTAEAGGVKDSQSNSGVSYRSLRQN
jgi:excisionase family DNA binding protein